MNDTRTSTLLPLIATLSLVAACGSDAPESGADEPATPAAATPTADKPAKGEVVGTKDVKPFGPVRISHRIIGTPVVGQPVQIDLDIRSAYGPLPVELSYRIPDTTALTFPADQPQRVSLAAPQDERTMGHQVSVVPQREGRLYLNVSAEIKTAEGPQSTVMAIPTQVGAAPRELEHLPASGSARRTGLRGLRRHTSPGTSLMAPIAHIRLTRPAGPRLQQA